MSKVTIQAVSRQIAAMSKVDRFEIGIRNQSSEKMMIRHFGSIGLMKSIKWLSSQNIRNHDIYIRPEKSLAHPYLLLDDLEVETIENMAYFGFHHCLMLETSRNNHQLLIPLPKCVDVEQRKRMERALCERFGSDPGSCDGQHFFRLAGFTNRKPEHSGWGKIPAPWVLLTSSTPDARISVEAWNWLTSSSEVELKVDAEKSNIFGGNKTPNSVPVSNLSIRCVTDKVKSATEVSDELMNRLTTSIDAHLPHCENDRSRAEWRACCNLLRTGVPTSDLVITLASIADRKGANATDYAERTVRKAAVAVA